MQEHTILDLTPLGIDSNTTFGHFVKCIRLRTILIQKPSFKHKAVILGCRSIIIGLSFIIRSHIGIVCNTTHLIYLTVIYFRQRVVVTIHINTIKISDGINFT